MGDFKGVTFSAQNVTPKDDGALYNAHYGDGILDGCTMAISGDDLVIQPGHFIACGRVCHVDGATSVDLSGRTLQTGYIQVIMNYDLTQGEGQQWYTTFIESATTTFPALTQDDINTPTGELYQLELAVVQISGGNLTSVTSSLLPSFMVAQRYTSKGIGGNSPHVDFRDDTNKILGTVWVQLSSGDFRIYGYGTDGETASSGLYMEQSGRLVLFGHQNNIVLRPNAVNSTSGQVYFTPAGQQYGGHFINSFNTAGNITCNADVTTVIQSATGLETSGVYLITATCVFVPSASTTTQFRISLASSNDSYTNSLYASNGGASHMAQISGLFTGVTTVNFGIRPYSGSVSCTANSRKIEITRLA